MCAFVFDYSVDNIIDFIDNVYSNEYPDFSV